MTMPNFLVLGAARSGTTSLHYYLQQHPRICMSTTKEPNFFLFDHRAPDRPPLIAPDRRLLAKSVRDPERYSRLFRVGPEHEAVGEASPLYLYTAETPALVRHVLGDEVRLIAVLREPVSRAYSHFLHVYRGRREDVLAGFAAAVGAEMGEGYSPYRTGTHFLRLGRYGEQLARYREVFPASALHVLFQGELASDPQAGLRDIFGFLGVDQHDVDTSVQYNPSGVVDGAGERRLRGVVRRVQPWAKRVLPPRVVARLAEARARSEPVAAPPPLPDDLRARLHDYYASDTAALQELLGRPVPWSGDG